MSQSLYNLMRVTLTKCQTNFFINSCDKLQLTTNQLLTSSAPKMSADIRDQYLIRCPKFGQTIQQNLCPVFLSHFWLRWGDSVMMLTVSSFKVRQPCEGMLQFHLSW
jgi:hypothetical protein